MKRILLFAFAILAGSPLLLAQEQRHFMTDAAYRQKVEKVFNEKMKQVGKQFFDTKNQTVSLEEKEALTFLYAYMATADVTDYTTSFYLKNVRSSFATREQMAWGRNVPELLFRHFVLPVRVNNENLDSSRWVFYNELKDRVRGLSMKEAILEVNHWCHEKVTYQPSDARTSSPLASIRSAYGRCGEESTFTVAALRSVGIPARQVYTPRWAHTDDNHAWVEAWADGEWYFLGACEPEAVLNLGWFNAPASRAMLMHTRAFGDYNGPEEVVLRTNNFTEINLIDNYAKTARIDFRVADGNGNPVEGAKVEFKIYNYAEFYTAVTKYTDSEGRTFLTSGLGDLLVWASKNNRYGFAKASFGKDRTIEIVLDRSTDGDLAQKIFSLDSLNIVPPPENVRLPVVSAEQSARNKKRFDYEDSLRNAYVATFLDSARAVKINRQGWKYLVKARGNHAVIADFMARHSDNYKRVDQLLGSLSDKDLRDMQMDILEDNFTARSSQVCPRVEDEMIILPYKHILQDVFKQKDIEKFRKDPSLLVAWVKKNIRINPDSRAMRIAQTPVGVWNSRFTDSRSRDIFFVSLARSIDIEARKDVVTGKVQYKTDGRWYDVDFDAKSQTVAPTGTLVLRFTPNDIVEDPKYYSHFTVSRIVDGSLQLLNFEEGQVDMGGGTSWSNTFRNGTQLDEGTYMLVSGMRMANGSVLTTNQIFNINKGKTTTLDLHLRQSDEEVSVIGSFDSESKFQLVDRNTFEPTGDMPVSILSQTGRGYFVVGVIGVGQEPTNHALRDIAKMKTQLDAWGRPFVLLFENVEDARKFHVDGLDKGLPANTVFGIDTDGQIKKQIVAQMRLQNDKQLPMVIIADTFNRVVFCTQGYTIGLGETILGTAKKL
ncbi:MAG: transglutaminase domain-containing protein [Prevotella sp.]|nr:transglutaminase domain-containing protein [Prevotella sp.]MBQ9669620.1 transglutaminase domain-containing protein [Prevotella sp.]MBR1526733.1 transglutaminase domain-containing protein [Prevotella sp.]